MRLVALTGRERPTEKLDIYGEAALVKLFEIAFELALRTLQDYLRYRNFGKVQNPAHIIQLALDNGIISDREQWHDMQRDSDYRNYIYNPGEMRNIAQRIYNSYVFTLNALDDELRKCADEA